MKNRLPAVFILGAALTLSGCQSFSFLGLGPKSGPELGPQDLTNYFGQRLADGRQHLESGRYAAAVTAFRQASYDPSRAAPSYNGMAVAYARLGRDDLAQRYFMAALKIDPRNEAYARNLARLDASQLRPLPGGMDEKSALASDTHTVPSTPSAQEAVEALLRSSHVTVEPRLAQLERVSDREVHIAQRPEPSHPRTAQANAASEVRTANNRMNRPGYPIRIELPDTQAQPARESRPNVIRIELKEAKPVRQAEASEYPIRIALSDVPKK